MQFIKRLGTQLGFVVLMGSSMFSASSANADTCTALTPCSIPVNTDVVINPAFLSGTLFPGATQVDVLRVGGVLGLDNSSIGIDIDFSMKTYDPFFDEIGNTNNKNVGGSNLLPSQEGTELFALYTAIPSNPPLRLNLNSPTYPYPYDGINCTVITNCIALHYGYTETITPAADNNPIDASITVNPSLKRSYIQLQNPANPSQFRLRQYSMVSPNVIIAGPTRLSAITPLLQNTPTEYFVVYTEQVNPQQPGVAMVNWTEIPITPGQTPRLNLVNNADGSVMASNTRVMRSDTEIPLENLNAAIMPPTSAGFVAVPSADGIIEPGTSTPSVEVNPPLRRTITFDEFPVGTAISDQYNSLGIIFDGDGPFITEDGSNPTSPVLSGTPLFFGAVTGTFVDPNDGVTPATVDGFQLDAGSFDEIDSTLLSWYDSDGNLLGQQTNPELGIYTFRVNAPGIASWRIEIINDEPFGYAIDNVSFAINQSETSGSLPQ